MSDKEAKKLRNRRLKTLSRSKKSHVLNSARVIKYGVKGLSRNAWLTLAAILVMTISLVIISATTVSRFILDDTVDSIKNTIEMSVYLKNETDSSTANKIASNIGEMRSVSGVNITSPTEAKDQEIQRLREKTNNEDIVNAAIDAPNLFPWIINVSMVDLSDTSELDWYLANSQVAKDSLDNRENSADHAARVNAINKIASTTTFVERVGIILGVVFAIVGSLIIFNTIRMAIFNRKEEIYMMKLVGAGKSFIRGPFLVEAMMYGIISAILTVSLVVGGLFLLETPLSKYGVVVGPTLNLIKDYIFIAVIGVMLLGALVGIASAMLAARKYLKIR